MSKIPLTGGTTTLSVLLAAGDFRGGSLSPKFHRRENVTPGYDEGGDGQKLVGVASTLIEIDGHQGHGVPRRFQLMGAQEARSCPAAP